MLAPLSIPSPDQGVWYLGPVPLRGYALAIIAGIVVAVWLGERRLVARGGRPGQVQDIAIWAVPFGIVGGRLYHVITDAERYFGAGQDPVEALYIWQGGLGIWGAVGLGALGAYIGARRQGVRFAVLADAVAPGIVLAQAIGRLGNYVNQELFGGPTDLPWALEISPEHRPAGYADFATFHPTFLYEALWNVGVAVLLIWADRRFRLGHGRVFALYVAAYCAGRVWIENLRIDPVAADDVLGLRLNVWTSLVMMTAAIAYFVWSARTHPGREPSALVDPGGDDAPDAAPDAGTDPASTVEP